MGGDRAPDLLARVAQVVGPLPEWLEAGGVALDRREGAVAGKVLGRSAREGAIEVLSAVEGLAVTVDLEALSVASERDVSGVAVHHRIGDATLAYSSR